MPAATRPTGAIVRVTNGNGPLLYSTRVRVRHAGCVTETIQGPTRGVQIGEEDGSHLILLSSTESTALDAFVIEFEKRNGRALEILHRRPTELLFRGRASER